MDDLNWQYVLVQLDLTSYLYRTKQSYLSTEVQEPGDHRTCVHLKCQLAQATADKTEGQ